MLPHSCQHLLPVLSDTPVPYFDISATLGIFGVRS